MAQTGHPRRRERRIRVHMRKVHRPMVAAVILLVIPDPSSPHLRLHCALALAQFDETLGRCGRRVLAPWHLS
jgi:hypothetical protein